MADGGEPAVELIHVVFAVVVPNPHPLLGLFAQEIAPGRHREALDHLQAGFACSTGCNGAARSPTLVMLSEQELPRWKLRRIKWDEWPQHERRGRAGLGVFFRFLLRVLVTGVAVALLAAFFRAP